MSMFRLPTSNSVNMLLNMDGDIEIGSAVSRLGRATIGAQITAAMNILGLVQHIDVDTASNNKLFATLNASRRSYKRHLRCHCRFQCSNRSYRFFKMRSLVL